MRIDTVLFPIFAKIVIRYPQNTPDHRCKKLLLRFFCHGFLRFKRFFYFAHVFILFLFFGLTHIQTSKTKHSNSRLCIGLQLQAQKLAYLR